MRASAPRGFTLLETVIAMGVLLIGSIGLMSIHNLGAKMNADARVMTRATAIAQDLVNQIQLWSYDDARLANTDASNDATYSDPTFAFETTSPPTPDHDEPELAGAGWNGIPSAQVTALGFRRSWNIAEVDDANGNGIPDAKRVAVIVRWVQNGAPRRTVLLTTVLNPGDMQ